MTTHRLRRWSDNDSHLGRFITYAPRSGQAWFGAILDSGDEESPGCHLRLYLGWYTVLIDLPQIIQPSRRKVVVKSWDAETVARMGRDWYYDVHEREFGFSLVGGHLSFMYGPQTHDSTSTKRWGYFLPWTQWRHVRYSYYDAAGKHFWTEGKRERYEVRWAVEEACPKATFEFDDYDGKRIQATTRIREREARFGEGWFKWLSLFRRARVYRSLDIKFSEEVGPEKGSWKGGTTGHSIEMLPGELHEAAFKRYCEQEQQSKYDMFRIVYVGLVA